MTQQKANATKLFEVIFIGEDTATPSARVRLLQRHIARPTVKDAIAGLNLGSDKMRKVHMTRGRTHSVIVPLDPGFDKDSITKALSDAATTAMSPQGSSARKAPTAKAATRPARKTAAKKATTPRPAPRPTSITATEPITTVGDSFKQDNTLTPFPMSRVKRLTPSLPAKETMAVLVITTPTPLARVVVETEALELTGVHVLFTTVIQD
jgi:hypothetical protein